MIVERPKVTAGSAPDPHPSGGIDPAAAQSSVRRVSSGLGALDWLTNLTPAQLFPTFILQGLLLQGS